MIILKLFLVRHGKDTPNIRGGWSKESLTDEGIEEVILLSKSLEQYSYNYILSSDLVRAKETTELIIKNIDWSGNIIYDARLREVNNGNLSGMPNHLAEKEYPGVYWNQLDWEERYPYGESPKDFFDRISLFFNYIKKNFNDSDNLLIITHQGVIEVILCIINKIDFSNKRKKYTIPTASLNVIEI